MQTVEKTVFLCLQHSELVQWSYELLTVAKRYASLQKVLYNIQMLYYYSFVISTKANSEVFMVGWGRHPIRTIAISPVIIESMPHFLVDCWHGFHVALPPLSPKILCLHFEKLQNIELHHGLLHFKGSFQNGSRLEHHQHLGGEINIGRFLELHLHVPKAKVLVNAP